VATAKSTCDACDTPARLFRRRDGRCLCDPCIEAENESRCAYCGRDALGDGASIHRDGFCRGPQVRLCLYCGAEDGPTCEEIWARIAERRAQ
jgi:hypothetical protein